MVGRLFELGVDWDSMLKREQFIIIGEGFFKHHCNDICGLKVSIIITGIFLWWGGWVSGSDVVVVFVLWLCLHDMGRR